jgi:hypothetical protein
MQGLDIGIHFLDKECVGRVLPFATIGIRFAFAKFWLATTFATLVFGNAILVQWR